MTPGKRAFDLVCAGVLLVALILPGALLALVLLCGQGRPVFHVSERMRTPDRAFRLIKFRTMTPAATDHGVTGPDKKDRITRIGALLRRSRMDELPQLWNVLRGDMSFVGPRPPLRQYVDARPTLYAAVLRSRPGVTGLATLVFRDREPRLLSRCTTACETDAVYLRRCVPRKAALDLLYQRHASVCWDGLLIAATLVPALPKRLRLTRPRRSVVSSGPYPANTRSRQAREVT